MQEEYIDYENVEKISNDLKEISSKISTILEEINKNMQNINTESYFKSNASIKLLDKFNKTSSKFYKFSKEIETNSLYLDRKIIEYTARTKTSANFIEDTTSTYLTKLGGQE